MMGAGMLVSQQHRGTLVARPVCLLWVRCGAAYDVFAANGQPAQRVLVRLPAGGPGQAVGQVHHVLRYVDLPELLLQESNDRLLVHGLAIPGLQECRQFNGLVHARDHQARLDGHVTGRVRVPFQPCFDLLGLNAHAPHFDLAVQAALHEELAALPGAGVACAVQPPEARERQKLLVRERLVTPVASGQEAFASATEYDLAHLASWHWAQRMLRVTGFGHHPDVDVGLRDSCGHAIGVGQQLFGVACLGHEVSAAGLRGAVHVPELRVDPRCAHKGVDGTCEELLAGADHVFQRPEWIACAAPMLVEQQIEKRWLDHHGVDGLPLYGLRHVLHVHVAALRRDEERTTDQIHREEIVEPHRPHVGASQQSAAPGRQLQVVGGHEVRTAHEPGVVIDNALRDPGRA
mmetsp:Transcript_24785/g.77993  ORF Transcript_24785/g.77993 Transcript_24785/m.77993 type:complete len:404 (-) Transcript_24785:655-1866(-)